MPSMRILCGVALALALIFSNGTAKAQAVGVVLDAVPGAIVERDGTRGRLVERSSIVSGDVIRTDANGTVQIVFNDRTRIAIGPNSHFVVEQVEIGRSERARRFIVSALSGTFRFLSGRSAKQSYEIKTPTATLGIRGTVFDVAVERRGQTNVVTHEGLVRMCSRGRRCADVLEGCAMARTQSFGRVGPPRDLEERNSILARAFPFILSQSRLRPSFRARTENCGAVRDTVLQLRAPVPVNPPVATPTPQPLAGNASQGNRGQGVANAAAGSRGNSASSGGTRGASGSASAGNASGAGGSGSQGGNSGGNNSGGNAGGNAGGNSGGNSAGNSGGGNAPVKDAVQSGGN